MDNSEEIKKLKAGIGNKFLPDFAKAKLQAKLDALEASEKSAVAKSEPKAKKEKVAKVVTQKVEVKSEPKAKKKAGSDLFERANKIRKEGESWKDAVKRAGENKSEGKSAPKKKVKRVVRTIEKPKAKKVIKKSPKTYKAKAPKHAKIVKRYKRQVGSSNKELDKKVVAMPPSKRVVKKVDRFGFKNKHAGETYIEKRANRTDVSKKKKL